MSLKTKVLLYQVFISLKIIFSLNIEQKSLLITAIEI